MTAAEQRQLVTNIYGFNNELSDPAGGRDPGGFECANSVSAVLGVTDPFRGNIPQTNFPWTLRSRVATFEEKQRGWR